MATKPQPSNVVESDSEEQEQDDNQQQEAKSVPQTERINAKPATAPASQPEAAVSKPATDAAPRVVRSVIASVRDPQIPFEDNPAKVVAGLPADRAKDYMRTVACHVADTFKGRVRAKDGTYAEFRFIKNEVVALPKWFALSHPTRLVIKE